jgi:predicted aspartyl protease
VRIGKLLLLGAALVGGISCGAQIDYVPLQFRTVEGIRPFVPVELNGKQFLFMVHANATFYAQTTHGNAASAGITSKAHDADYGIDKPGHVSALGRTNTTLHTLMVGKVVAHDVPLSVFEVPVPDMDGMLGIAWLRGNGVIVDYDRQRLGFAATMEDALKEDARLVKAGFVAHAMGWDEKSHRYFVICEVNGKTARLMVSTVSSNVLDKTFAERIGIPLGPVVYLDFGPQGAQVPNYLTKQPVMITIEGQRTAWAQPIVQDTYAYSSSTKPDDVATMTGGYLGCDFMLANEAVIDFRSGRLMLKLEPSAQLGNVPAT